MAFQLKILMNDISYYENYSKSIKYNFTEGPCKANVLAILGPCFGFFYNIFSFRYLKWLKFSLESLACQIKDYHSMLDYWDHMRAMFGPY